MSKNIVVLISGRGSNFKAVYERSVQENWPEKYGVRISGVISNRPEAGGLTFAKENNIPFIALEDVRGDVNQDGDFTIADVVLLQKWLLDVPETQLVDWKSGDLYNDNVLNVLDLCLMKRELMK